jgi:chromosome segregation ATPase
VLEDGSAHLDGTLLPGDEILAVDSKAVAGLSAPQIRTALLGPQGSPVCIRIRKAGAQGEAREVDVHLARGSPSFFAQQRREQQLHLEAHALREELSTLRGSEQRRLDWEDEARSLRSGLASARAETTSLRRGLEDAQRANKRLDARLEMLTEREAAARARRDELEREISRRDAHSAHHGAGRKMETEALQRSLEETGEMLETKTARCAELEGEVHRLQEDLRRSQLRVATLEAREAQLEQLLIVQADEATLAHAELVKKYSAHVAELEAALDELRSGLPPKENAATTTNKVASAESAALHRLGRERDAGNGVLDAHGDNLNDVNAGADLGVPHTAARKVSLPETKISLPNKANVGTVPLKLCSEFDIHRSRASALEP